MPTRRSTRARHPLVIVGNAIFTVIFLLTVAAGVGFVIGKQRFEAPGPLAEDKVVNIPRGGIRDIADLLMREGVIDQPWLFIGGALVLKARDDLKFGEYQFAKHASLRDVVDTIIEGKVVQHQLTIAEGLTSEQIVQRLLENDSADRQHPRDPARGHAAAGDLQVHARHDARADRSSACSRRSSACCRRSGIAACPICRSRRRSSSSMLASIVEKETGKPEERTRVAAVFVNRLKQKMQLQSDPTIIYGLVGGKGTLGRPIMRSEIEQPTPYNTYVIDGLPPGPIANPGRASLEAAANPARTKELFFVADGTGGHAFAETYEQHQKNVARLRALEQQAAPQQPRRRRQPSRAGDAPARGAAASRRAATARPRCDRVGTLDAHGGPLARLVRSIAHR